MSETKLEKFLSSSSQSVVGARSLTPVIFSDSKGQCVKLHIDGDISRQIKWYSKPGLKIQDILKQFKSWYC